MAAGDDHVRAGQIDAGQDLVGGRGGGESGSEWVLFLRHASSLLVGRRTLDGCQFEFFPREYRNGR